MLSIRTRQIATVMALVAGSMLALGALHLASLVRVRLDESAARGELLARALFQQAQRVVTGALDPHAAIRGDPGIRATLESSIAYSRNVAYAVIVDASGVAVAHSSPALEGLPQPTGMDLAALLEDDALVQLRQVYEDTVLEITQPLRLGDTPFGAIRIGFSPALIRNELERSLRPAAVTVAGTLAAALLISLVLAHWVLAPIHVIRAGLSRLGRGEHDVRLELPADRAFTDVEESFEAISRRLSAGVQEDASTNRSPESTPATSTDAVGPTVKASRQLAPLGRILAGVAHEVKNPLNAMTIHLELLRQKLEVPEPAEPQPVPVGSVLGVRAPRAERDSASPDVLRHVSILREEIRRLDDVIQGFLRFIRPDTLHKEAVAVAELADEVIALVQPAAHQQRVTLENRCPDDLPPVFGDRGMLRQALLNLALNACQAMPSGGTLRIGAKAMPSGLVRLDIEDTGDGMTPEQMERMFNLYYTTREGGSGIGLSMVYRIVQLHDGEIEVESTRGKGTRVRVMVPCGAAE